MDDVRGIVESLFTGSEIARDETGHLASMAGLLEPARPSLLFFAEDDARVVAADSLGSNAPLEAAGELARALAPRLADTTWCCVPWESGAVRGLAFAVRLEESLAPAFLGGLLEMESGAADRVGALVPVLRVCGGTGLAAVRAQHEIDWLRTQARHLATQQQTLKAAHTEATIQALEEHEARQHKERERLAMERVCQATEAANRAKSEFLANMSHEIRTPLNAILGFAELLRTGANGENESQREEYVSIIETSGRHLLDLVNDILDLSKIEAGQMTFERIECSPHKIVAQVMSLLRVRAREKNVSITCEWPDGVPATIQSDPMRISQLLVNLVGNAIKFTHEGSVRIVTRLVQEAGRPLLAFEVVDTGVGIAPEKLDSIFDPFVQADDSVTRQFGGTGLGLSISRRIAEALGGSLTVRSTRGQGSTFTATLDPGPMDDVEILDKPPADGLSADVGPHRQEQIALGGTRVLVVEDGQTNAKLIRLILTRAGAEVVTAENGELGLQRAREGPFDVILMDMQMPVMDGYTATRRLRELGIDVPVIAITAHAMASDEQRCRQAGCSGYLSKPVDGQRLLETIARCVGRCETARAPATSRTEGAGDDHGDDVPLLSRLPADDPELREIAAEFVQTLHGQLGKMRTAWREGDYETLARLAHALKGSGGSAGFPALTQPAKLLEEATVQAQPDVMEMALDTIEALAARIRVRR